MTNELTEVKQLEKRVRNEALRAQEELAAAVEEARRNADMLAEYRRCWNDPAMIHASCCDYRAGTSIDLVHDEADLQYPLACPTLVVWGADGLMCQLMDIEAAWSARCTDLRVAQVPGGHWFPEHSAPQTAPLLLDFFESRRA